MIYHVEETIAAISTAVTESGIGIVRMCGADAFAVADCIYRGKKNKKLADQKSHTIHYGFIVDGEEIVDEVLVMLMRAPHSYTRENTVEINCHGGVLVVSRVLDLLIRNGARPAEPGEFTKRAFLNGRMDLSQAEAVMDVIESKNTNALKCSVSQLKGSVRDKIHDIRNQIIHQMAFIESALDDPEHISTEGYAEYLIDILNPLKKEIKKLIDSADDGRIMKEGVKTIILGKPNVGKSSLLNALIGEDRAIVTDIAGTTRDTLQESINLHGITLNIIDTAGIRDTEDSIEKLGVKRALYLAKEADLILFVIDLSVSLDENDYEIFKILQNKQAIILLNKCDLPSVVSRKQIETIIYESKLFANREIPLIEISTKNMQGIDKFETILKQKFYHGNLSFNSEIYITNARHKKALEDAYRSISRVQDSIESKLPEDFYTIDLMEASEALGRITGETTGDDLIREIFSKFCVGK